jgi:hypothetical protein
VDVDMTAIAALTQPDGDVDRFIHELAEDAYERSQRYVPTPGRPEDPYATGALKASGRVRRTTDGWEVAYLSDHAIYPELGTRYMKAEPYLRPALLEAVRASERG